MGRAGRNEKGRRGGESHSMFHEDRERFQDSFNLWPRGIRYRTDPEYKNKKAPSLSEGARDYLRATTQNDANSEIRGRRVNRVNHVSSESSGPARFPPRCCLPLW